MTVPKNISNPHYPVAMTIAGSDSGGGAGIEADLRTFNAFAVFGTAAITALTSQNPREVRRIDATPPEAVRTQIETVLDAVDVDFAKTGMLFNAEIVRTVAQVARERRMKLVVDPVAVATSGAKLLEDEAVAEIRDTLLPLSSWITPNIPEAELLLDVKIRREDDLFQAAMSLWSRYHVNTVVKGGHFPGESAVDAAVWDGVLYRLSSPRLPDCGHSHGTGCTFSAALCAMFAAKSTPAQALKSAKSFIIGSLNEPIGIGPELKAMYPPELDYSDEVELTKL